jgi:hypothetical protein
VTDTVRATYDGFVGTPTGDVRLVEGEEWPAADPVVKANPHLFTSQRKPAKSAPRR